MHRGGNKVAQLGWATLAKRLGSTPMQVALAWLLRRAPNIALIPGTSRWVIYEKIWQRLRLSSQRTFFLKLEDIGSDGP